MRAAALLALLAWEALCRPERPPIGALAVIAIVWVTFESAPAWLSPDMQSILFVAWSLPLAAWLAFAAFAAAPSVERRGSEGAAPAAQWSHGGIRALVRAVRLRAL